MTKILFFNWKDIRHPQSGGAEIVTHELAKKLIAEGNKVTLITAKYQNSSDKDEIDGVEIYRIGNKFSHYPLAIKLYLKSFKNQFDIIVEEVNTIPYFINFFKGKEKMFLFYHQLCRITWFKEMIFPINLIGYIIEPVYTFIQSLFKNPVITVSNSSKNDLCKYGFKKENIHIITEGILTKPLKDLSQSKPKESKFTILFHGSLRSMKRPLEVFKAYNNFLENLPENERQNTQLWISGDGSEKQKCENFAKQNNFFDKVVFFGRTSDELKLELMQKTHILCSTSIKEGWGLIVSEANSMGTPAVVYDVDGLRDAGNMPGNFVVKPDFKSLSEKIKDIYLTKNNNFSMYIEWQSLALESGYKINFDNCYKDFKQIIGI
jgi:glycosyltransferase involved in cell wall biosynthesis